LHWIFFKSTIFRQIFTSDDQNKAAKATVP
jgi:hypothetical protein